MKKLTRWDECPKGKDCEPGSLVCEKCKYYVSTELRCEGPASGTVTRCRYHKEIEDDKIKQSDLPRLTAEATGNKFELELED